MGGGRQRVKAKVPAPGFYFVSFNGTFLDYNMHVEGLLPVNLYLVTLVSLEHCSKIERFRLQRIQMVKKTSSFKTELIGSSAKVSRVNSNDL